MKPGILFQRNGWQSFSLVWSQVIEHEIIDTCMLNVKIVSDPVLTKTALYSLYEDYPLHTWALLNPTELTDNQMKLLQWTGIAWKEILTGFFNCQRYF